MYYGLVIDFTLFHMLRLHYTRNYLLIQGGILYIYLSLHLQGVKIEIGQVCNEFVEASVLDINKCVCLENFSRNKRANSYRTCLILSQLRLFANSQFYT